MIKIKNITEFTKIHYSKPVKQEDGTIFIENCIIAPGKIVNFETEEEMKVADNLLQLYKNQLQNFYSDSEMQTRFKEQELELEKLKKQLAEQEEVKPKKEEAKAKKEDSKKKEEEKTLTERIM
jgi:hypothetical protein